MSRSHETPSLFSPIVRGLLCLSLAIFLFLCLATFSQNDSSQGALGVAGQILSSLLFYLLGLPAFLIPLFLGFVGVKEMRRDPLLSPRLKSILFALFLANLSLLLAILAHNAPSFAALFRTWVYVDNNKTACLGGAPLQYLYGDAGIFSLKHILGTVGTLLSALVLLLCTLLLLCGSLLLSLWERLLSMKKNTTIKNAPLSIKLPKKSAENPPSTHRPETSITEKIKVPALPRFLSAFNLPSPTLLTLPKRGDLSSLKGDLQARAKTLEETLLSFGIEAKVGTIQVGPTITSFEVHPASGVKVQRIKALENDIALNLQAKSIRIIAPIPGKAAVGIEVPNPSPQEVGFRELLENYQRSERRFAIPLLLGKGVSGDDVCADLAKMPHLLIAGATGSGKSVCINVIVLSIIMNTHPDEIKLLMVDPKKVELTSYSPLPHMLAPVITEPGEAHSAFQWLVKEMERRYEMFRLLGHRHIQSFNERARNEKQEAETGMDVPLRLPYIVVIVDELADLMMASQNDIETPIARIAQMARAVGIHLILATQRPSREVITGLIKANFPTRIAFKVASRINSQIIIDDCGAETLLGNGDLLFLPPGASALQRAQGAFVREEEITKVLDHLTRQRPPQYLVPSFKELKSALLGKDEEGESNDPLFNEAKKTVLETGNASTTFLQRKLKIGYARAASLMDLLEAQGTIGPQDGAKPRKIFYPKEAKWAGKGEENE